MITASQLIREAALKTGTYEFKPGKVVSYQDKGLVPVEDEICWLCGGETGGQGVPIKIAIKQTFTDHPYARGHSSKSVCPGCAFCLSYRELRNYSTVANPEGIKHPTRAELKDILLQPPEPPFVVCIAVSGQKHITFKAPVNYNRDLFTVMLEEQEVTVESRRLFKCLQLVELMYVYFTKDEIASGRYNHKRVREMGIKSWERYESEVRPWRGTQMFELVLFIAQKGEKGEDAAEENNREPERTGQKFVQQTLERL